MGEILTANEFIDKRTQQVTKPHNSTSNKEISFNITIQIGAYKLKIQE